MTVEGLAADVREKLGSVRYDQFVEKHEGPWEYKAWPGLDDTQFLMAEGFWILLPLHTENHPNITFERVIDSRDGQTLMVYIRDTTFIEPSSNNIFEGYFLAVCEKFPGQEFFVATLYHERYCVEPLPN